MTPSDIWEVREYKSPNRYVMVVRYSDGRSHSYTRNTIPAVVKDFVKAAKPVYNEQICGIQETRYF